MHTTQRLCSEAERKKEKPNKWDQQTTGPTNNVDPKGRTDPKGNKNEEQKTQSRHKTIKNINTMGNARNLQEEKARRRDGRRQIPTFADEELQDAERGKATPRNKRRRKIPTFAEERE